MLGSYTCKCPATISITAVLGFFHFQAILILSYAGIVATYPGDHNTSTQSKVTQNITCCNVTSESLNYSNSKL